MNDALFALWTISALLGLLGAILLIVGGSLNASVDPYSGAPPLPGLPQLIWGGALLGVAIPAFFAALTVVAVNASAGAAPRLRGEGEAAGPTDHVPGSHRL
jgi:hypothetical protein